MKPDALSINSWLPHSEKEDWRSGHDQDDDALKEDLRKASLDSRQHGTQMPNIFLENCSIFLVRR